MLRFSNETALVLAGIDHSVAEGLAKKISRAAKSFSMNRDIFFFFFFLQSIACDEEEADEN